MKRPRHIPQATRDSQATAADPTRSAWVSANAGSGKTHVLSQRVVRLLLDGADPSRILCLTYTKAAAANMATRVYRDLGRWTGLSDDELAREIADLEKKAPAPGKLSAARRLFARALETPGGLKIQTIHAFCEAVLHKFPLEANIAGHFELLDGQMESALVAEAKRLMLTGVAANDPTIVGSFAAVLSEAGEAGLDDLLTAIVAHREELKSFIGHFGTREDLSGALLGEFGFAPGTTEAQVAAASLDDAYFSAGFADALFDAAMANGGRGALDLASGLKAAHQLIEPLARHEMLRELFLRQERKGEWVARSSRTVATKAIAALFPELAAEHSRFCDELIGVCDRLATLRMLRATTAALTLADWLIERYERLKSARGMLDFNDLISRTAALLSRSDAAAWVQYKLDKGIDHILLDEAQDTSPQQWAVVRLLADEFFSGRGARDNAHRTIFAVGDEKQSIYSFQGAEPREFGENRERFANRVRAAGGEFEKVRLPHSFRSTADVLKAVDTVFGAPDRSKGLTFDGDLLEHFAIRDGEPGYVELWPSIQATSAQEPEDWTEAIDHATAPAVQLAERIAGTIRRWIHEGERIEGQGRPLRSGDILVLVRRRDSFIHALSRALKNLRHPAIHVAGADRLNLRTHIAVKDLVALGRVALQPHDDLSLAALLRSPIFGLSEEALFSLADGREGKPLIDSLVRAGAKDSDLTAIADSLRRWRSEVDFRPPFEFYAAILSRDGVRRALVQRLGHEVHEILDEFLAYCLAAERAGSIGLEQFLTELETAAPDIKREMDQSRDEVRIMTVHASKGLEAPVVFLVDGGSAAFSSSHRPRLVRIRSHEGRWPGDGWLWRASGNAANATLRSLDAETRERAEEEYRRLLYVGMTRAEDRLIMCGYHGKTAARPENWHGMVSAALDGVDTEARLHPVTGETVRRFRVTPAESVVPAPEQPGEARGDIPLPDLNQPLAAAPRSPRPLAPSAAGSLAAEVDPPEDPLPSPVLSPQGTESFSLERGTAIHRLMQMLPAIETDKRKAAARRYLEWAGSRWPETERDRALRDVLAIFEDPDFAPIFAPGSRAEVAVMGSIALGGEMRQISAKIDRMCVDAEAVRIIDYKTNASVPVTAEAVPQAYVLQLAIYARLLAPLYPGRRIEAALLYTGGPRLIVLPQAMLVDALALVDAQAPTDGSA